MTYLEDTAFTISQGKIKVMVELDLITLEKCITKVWRICEPAYGKLP